MQLKKYLKIHIIIILIFLISTAANASVFDNIEWKFEKIKNDISLYIKGSTSEINYYKAESTLKDLDTQILLKYVLDFEKYSDIFACTKFFKIVKTLDKNRYILSVELNFFPYRNRTYFIECIYDKKTINGKNEYVIEWYPVDKSAHPDLTKENKHAKLISFIHGRWTIKELDNKNIYISINYHNDWETNLPFSFIHEIEKMVTIRNLASLIKYCQKHG